MATGGLQILIDCAYSLLDLGIKTLDIASGASGIALAFYKLRRLTATTFFTMSSLRQDG